MASLGLRLLICLDQTISASFFILRYQESGLVKESLRAARKNLSGDHFRLRMWQTLSHREEVRLERLGRRCDAIETRVPGRKYKTFSEESGMLENSHTIKLIRSNF